MSAYIRFALFLIIASISAIHTAQAQTPDTLSGLLPDVYIEAARTSETEATAPFTVSVMTRGAEEAALEPGLSLDDVLNPLPGLWVNDRGHFALGERMVIRGMGWRSAFGVRGIQVLLDGIPLTMPDGQAITDIIEPSFVRRAELIRGPASLFWGNASGGVLALSTKPQANEPSARARVLAGSYGLRQVAAEANAQSGRHRAFVSHIEQDGYRSYSEGRFLRAGLNSSFDLGPRTQLAVMAAAADQDAQNPGGLTAEQVAMDRRMAVSRNVETRAGKQSQQVQVGSTLLHDLDFGLLSVTAYGLIRDLQNPLSFAFIDVYRHAGGGRITLQNSTGPLEWGFGADAGIQRDDRSEISRVGGSDLDQLEVVTSEAAFGYLNARASERISLMAGLRADLIGFDLDDNLPGDGDDSGRRTFSAWSPSVGISYRLPNSLLFANYSTAFETPTTTELVNRPDGAGGFNPELKPQRTRGVEAGARGAWPDARLSFDAAMYVLSITNGLIPFQSDTDETFFRNTGENLHRGVELSLTWDPIPQATAQLTYTGNRFTFEDAALEGNRVPGVPDHRVYASLQTTRRGFWGRIAAESVSSYYVDDNNTTKNDGYVVFDVYAGHTGLSIGRAKVLPFFKIANLLDRTYNNSIILNASFNRFFEPAPGRTIQAGVNVTL